MTSKLKKFASSLGESLWPIILDNLKEQSVKFIVEKLLVRIAASSTMGLWFSTLLAQRFTKEFVLPSVKALAVEGVYVVHVGEGKYLVKKLEGAQTREEYRDAVNDILS